MGIHRLLHSSFCFLNTNTAITRQLIRTARTLEAEWWQICGEVWVWGQRKICQVLSAFGLLDFTILRPVLAWRAFLNLWTLYSVNFPNLGGGGRPTADTVVHLYSICRFTHSSKLIFHSYMFSILWIKFDSDSTVLTCEISFNALRLNTRISWSSKCSQPITLTLTA